MVSTFGDNFLENKLLGSKKEKKENMFYSPHHLRYIFLMDDKIAQNNFCFHQF